MWRQWQRECMGLLALLLITGSALVTARAQQPESDFAALFARWQQAKGVDERIALGEDLLRRETQLTSWPLAEPRDETRGELQFGVGSAYLERTTGIRAENIEAAIALLTAAEPVWTFERNPQNWAALHNSSGIAYWARVRGERTDNQERAIAHFEAALRATTREAAPESWARLQNNLAIVHSSRVHGVAADNLEAAIRHFEAALSVFTRDGAPVLWAMAQNNLGSVYRRRISGNRAENHEKAIAHLESALTVFTRDGVPTEWASAHHNLATAYLSRIGGNRAENQERAIAHLDAALTVFTRDGHPMQWAGVQDAIGNAYSDRVRGVVTINREVAIAAYEAALTVFTRDAFPRQHMRTGRALGHLLLLTRAWQEAGRVHASAREAFLLLFGQGFEETEARALIADAGPLFAEAALGALERGDTDAAIALADEGRAHLLAVSLRLKALELPADGRQRLDTLRAAIRARQLALEAASGSERAAALEQLAALRRELLDLVKAGGPGEDRQKIALAEARRITAAGGAVAIPVVTALGGRLIVLAGNADEKPTVIGLPELTPERLSTLLAGADGNPGSGWIAAYFANYFQGAEQNKRWPGWLAAIEDLGPELWRLFGRELAGALRARGLETGARLVWVPSGWLGVLPLSLAQDPESKRRLADQYEITLTPSLATLAAARPGATPSTPQTLAAAINPTGDLPGSEAEGDLIGAHFADGARTLLVRRAATPEAVLAALKGRSHWHFASHGTFSWSNVRQSALIMHGPERLSVGRLLDVEDLGRPRLVVLSACETGLSEIIHNPDEFVGLPGAFLALGAAGVLGTLWPVSDVATALLVARFYELHIGEGLRPATALHRAQSWLRNATNTELAAYTRAAAGAGRIASRHADDITEALSEDGLKRSRSSAAIEWITAPTRADGQKGAATPRALARPYAHPYFWAGFVHTGH